MTGPRVFEFAKEVGMETLALMNKLKDWNIPVKNHMAELDEQTVVLIRQKFEEENSKSQPVKKKAAKKKVTTQAVSADADGESSAKPVKKKTVKKAEPETTGSATKKVVKKAAAVIRRKASEMAESRETTETIEQKEEVAAVPHELRTAPDVTTVEVEVAHTQAQAEVPEAVENRAAPQVEDTVVSDVTPVAAAPVAPTTTATPPRRPGVKREVVMEPQERGRNIVGRMDLSRAVNPNAPRGPSSGGQGGGGYRPGGFSGGGGTAAGPGGFRGRNNIRTGFVAQSAPPQFDVVDEKSTRRDFGKKKSTPGTDAPLSEGAVVKEGEEVPQFSAAEFRKREMIFQPKKKKDSLGREALKTMITTPKASKRIVKVHEKIQVAELAKALGLKSGALITHLMKQGMMVTQNDMLDYDTVALVAPEFGYETENVKKTVSDLVQAVAFGNLDAEKISRPPIVTVMGHVDHGKTSLLDAIRKADVASGEAGGITQHIGAYSVKLDSGETVTFIDTPGHAAFTAMRARGANVTDIAIIVVAADDGMMPQTSEAISHAKAAGVPIIVAINKMDKPSANPDRIKQQLTEFELVPEEWGGTTIYCPVSALQKTGIKELLEQIIVVAEVAELKANPERSGTGIVIESKMEKGRGVVATILVKDGTVKQGQSIVAGKAYGKVRAMINDKGQQVKEAGPSTPVEVLGLNTAPAAGDSFDICENEAEAEKIARARIDDVEKAKQVASSAKLSLEELFSKVQAGDVKELPIVLKTDVAGSGEAIVGLLAKEFGDKQVKVKVVHNAVGGISESDVLLASTAKGIVVGFNVRPDSGALQLAKQEGIEIKSYSIIYELMDELKKALEGLLEPDIIEKVVGHAEVRNTFTVPKMGLIAGCFVTNGKVQRGGLIRVLRDGRIIYDGKIGSLKRFKDDAKEVATGFECGVGVENFNDIKVGDTLEVYEKEVIAKTL